METDKNISCEANETGLSLNGSADVKAPKEEKPNLEEEAIRKGDSQQLHLDNEVQLRLNKEAQNDREPSSHMEHENVNEIGCKKEPMILSCAVPCPDEEAGFAPKAPMEEESVGKNDSQQFHRDNEVQPRLNKEARDDRELSCPMEDENVNEISCKIESGIPVCAVPRPAEEAGFANTPHYDNEAHYDRGWAWVVCGTAALMEFFVGGMITSSGVIYAALIEEFNKSRADTAWVSSLAVSTYYGFFPLGAIISERFGCWVTALLGCLACSIGLLSSSFVPSLPLLYLTYSLVWGMGASLVYFANLLILTKYFKARLAFANGLIALGGAIGGSALSPSMQQLIIHIGLANLFRVLAGAFLLLSGFTLVYRPRRSVLPQNSDESSEHAEKKPLFDLEILKNKAFLMWITVVSIFMLGYMVPFVHLVRLAEDIGIDKMRASLLLTFVTVGSGFGRVIFGRISDIRRFNRVNIVQIAFLVVGLSNFVVPVTESYPVLATNAFIFGLFGGGYLILNPVIVCDILGPKKVSYGLGMAFFVIAIPRTLGPLIAGWIYDGLQSYAIAFYTLGATTCVSAILATFVRILKQRKVDVENNNNNNNNLELSGQIKTTITQPSNSKENV